MNSDNLWEPPPEWGFPELAAEVQRLAGFLKWARKDLQVNVSWSTDTKKWEAWAWSPGCAYGKRGEDEKDPREACINLVRYWRKAIAKAKFEAQQAIRQKELETAESTADAREYLELLSSFE